jgi:hypothetical protein
MVERAIPKIEERRSAFLPKTGRRTMAGKVERRETSETRTLSKRGDERKKG